LGSRRYDTPDRSGNSPLLAALTLGEGWHNNHHFYTSCARQGFFWWELDVTYYTIKVLSWCGVVWDVREPPASVYAMTSSSQHFAPESNPPRRAS
jgi:stearoyl-CoA desaturase (delta-9 desaturase)